MNDMKTAFRKQLVAFSRIQSLFSVSPIAKSYVLKARNSRGFTLIETFVAITILVTAVAGPLTLAQKGLQSAILARDQLTASFLAQEGLEFVRERRDNNALANPPPSSLLFGMQACVSPSTCVVDPVVDTVVSCGGPCPVLRLDTTAGFYNYNPSNPVTPFTRTVTIIPNVNGKEAIIYSTVSWRTGTFQRSIVLQTTLMNWQ